MIYKDSLPYFTMFSNKVDRYKILKLSSYFFLSSKET